ncbi:MAG: ribbon-helix-helix protein, CopG family [Anaerolineales bacterium]|nr:MAG: ribbon-helix-helix protein, CopG family [Anaerolineales bacterium]
MKTISLRLELAQYERLRVLSFATHKPMSQIIREAIDTHLQQQPIKPGQEWFWTAEWQAAEREAEEDLATGRVQTFDNDADFLASLV